MLTVVQIIVPQPVFAEKQYAKEQIYFEDFNGVSDETLASWNRVYASDTAVKENWYVNSMTTFILEDNTSENDKALSMSGHKGGQNNFFYFKLPGDITGDGIDKYEITFDYYANGSWCDWFYLSNAAGTSAGINMNYSQGWRTVSMTVDLENGTWKIGNSYCADANISSVLDGSDLTFAARLHGNAVAGNKIKIDNFCVYKLYESLNYDIYDDTVSLYDKLGNRQEDINNVDIKLGRITVDFGDEEVEEATVTEESVSLSGDVLYDISYTNGMLSLEISSKTLEFGKEYILSIDGLKLKNGMTVSKKDFIFRTIKNETFISDDAYIEYEDFEDWTNTTCSEHYNDAYITLGGFRTWTVSGVVNGKDGGKALTPMYGAVQAARSLQYYFVPKLERDTFTIEYDFYTGDIYNFSNMTLGVYRTKDGYGMNMIPFDGMAAPGAKAWGHTVINFAAGTGVWSVRVLDDQGESVYENSGTWADSSVALFDWVFSSIDASKNTADENVPKIDNFIVNVVYTTAPRLTQKSISIYEGETLQSADAVSPASNKIIIDFDQRMMPDDMTKDNIYITKSGDLTPVTTTDRYSNGKYELSPVEYLEPGGSYTIHINKCRNVNSMEMSGEQSFDFKVGSGEVSVKLISLIQNGSEVTSASELLSGSAKLQMEYQNSTGEKYLFCYILAFYKGNEMVFAEYNAAELDNFSEGQTSAINISIPQISEEYDEVDVIAWDSYSKMLPVSKSLVLK